MSSSQTDDLAEHFAKFSFRNIPSSKVTTSKESPDAEDENQPPRASLMGIPRETRNQIFQYVYNTHDEPSHPVGMRVRIGPFKPHDPDYLLRPQTSLSGAPATKSSILVCRRLYAEMKKMNYAAFRKFYSTNTFCTRVPLIGDLPTLTGFDAPEDQNLRHIEHFIVYPSCLGVVVPVYVKFEAGRWNAYVQISEQLWTYVRSRVDRLMRVAAPRGRQRLVNFEREMHVNTSCDHRKGCFCGRISDPKLGRGLTARYIWIAHTIARILILEGRGGWIPVQ
jgi:hypothetical protein